MTKPKSKRPFEIQEKMRVAAKIFAEGFLSLQEVADEVGVHRSTLWRWWQHKEFRQYCEKVRRKVVGDLMREIKKQLRAERMEIEKRIRQMELESEEKQRKEFERWLRKQTLPEEEIERILRDVGAT